MKQTPQFKIHGLRRIKLKSKRSELNSFIKTFWHDHMMDSDMASFYGGEDDLMSDENARKMYDKKELELKYIDDILSKPYKK